MTWAASSRRTVYAPTEALVARRVNDEHENNGVARKGDMALARAVCPGHASRRDRNSTALCPANGSHTGELTRS